MKIAEIIIDAADNLPITLGTSASGTNGSHGGYGSTPSMPKTNLDVLFGYYYQLAEQISIPIVMQDYPQTLGVEMPVDFVVKVANEIPNVKYLKLEDPPTPTKISAIRNKILGSLEIFGGPGRVFLLDEL
jgi:2-keto-3-deoxy-L-arabinonate dehydratase